MIVGGLALDLLGSGAERAVGIRLAMPLAFLRVVLLAGLLAVIVALLAVFGLGVRLGLG